MGANKDLGLPRDKMKQIVVAFDIDGTLRCNCTSTCEHPNQRIVELARIFARMKNVRVIAWSGGGREYAQTFIYKLGLSEVIPPSRCYSKLNYFEQHGQVDIAIDDIQDTDLGKLNLIVREK